MFNSNETGLRSNHNYTNSTTYENATKVESLNITSTNDIKFHAQARVLQPYAYVSLVFATGSISVCVLVIIFAFKKNGKTFFKWKRAQRFLVVTSTCDILFYGVQLIFNIHVKALGPQYQLPPAICSIYAIFLLEFAYSQGNLSIIAAASACYYILKQAELNLGKYDWKMFLFMFVFPAIVLVTASFNGGMGHNGLYCGLKEGKGVLWNFFMIFIPVVTIIIVESILYILIWYKLHVEVKHIKKTIGNQSMAAKQIVVATRNMSFFVLVIILRFLTPAIHGCWVFIAEPPRAVYEINTYATCFGGIFNGIIYLTIRREQL